MKKYSGQAIAIIMIILVVATVLGASLYSRMIRNKEGVIDTRESQRALEQADNVLDLFVSTDLTTLQAAIQDKIKTTGTYTFNSIDELKVFFPSMFNNISSQTDWCQGDSSSSVITTISYGDKDSTIEYDVGEVMAINVGNVSVPVGCKADLTFTSSTSSPNLFALKYVYMDGSGNVTPYKLADMLLYCLVGSTSPDCSSIVQPVGSVAQNLSSGGKLTVDLKLANLYEVRVIPLKEKIGVSIVPNTQCGQIFNNYKVNTKVSCNGEVREKQVVIPNLNNMGYSSLFDYTIYNSNGTLSPS